jgi:lysozyme
VGIWTIGWGHTSAAGIPRVFEGQRISQEYADVIFRADICEFASSVYRLVKYPANENQFGAMTSLAYNIGVGAFMKSTVLRAFNEGNLTLAAIAFTWWNKAGGKILQGLVNRRAEEVKLFKTPLVPVPLTLAGV